MDKVNIDGIKLVPLKIIEVDKGNIFHALKKSDNGFSGFGEAYFSEVLENEVKAWKKHTKMIMNLIVPIGAIKFVFYDDRHGSNTYNSFYEIELSKRNYCRLVISPGLWFGFKGISKGQNLLLNISNIEHNPEECERKSINEIVYKW